MENSFDNIKNDKKYKKIYQKNLFIFIYNIIYCFMWQER